MISLPRAARFVIVGAGVHGLSTAWHLAEELEARGLGAGTDVLVIDKTGVGGGASGIACGVVRNNYFQPAMRELMAHSVGIWESDPDAFSYHPVGYLQISPEAMRADVATIYEQQRGIGYPSTFVEGVGETKRYLQRIFPDWRAQNVTSVLHEHRGGNANNTASMRGLARKAEAEGVRIIPGVRVTGFYRDTGAVTRVQTDHGDIRCEQVIVAAGPWVRDLWRMLDLPQTVKIRDPQGAFHLRSTWTYWSLQEGTLEVDPGFLTDANGNLPPVVHLDSDAPLHDADGNRVTAGLWGIYFKPDFHFGGVQGGAVPLVVDRLADQVAVDPYGPASSDFVVGAGFARLWTAGLAHCLERFEGKQHLFCAEPSGGIGCFTPDSFPVFDRFHDNVTVIADSNHGYKMIGVGALVAKELLGEPQALLEPFRHWASTASAEDPGTRQVYLICDPICRGGAVADVMISGRAEPSLLADQVYAVIREAILKGELPAGTRLRVRDLAAQVGTSVMPVREAIRRLEEAGLAERSPHKGAVVRGLTLPELVHVYDVRRLLEVEAARLGATGITPEETARMQAEYELMGTALNERRVIDYLDHDEALLTILYQAARNPVLVRLIRGLWNQCRAYKIVGAQGALESPSRESLLCYQRRLVAAARDNDHEAAAAIAEESLADATERIRSLLAAQKVAAQLGAG